MIRALENRAEQRAQILAVGLEQSLLTPWLDAMETVQIGTQKEQLAADAQHVGALIQQGWEFCQKLPLKSQRTPEERVAGENLVRMINGVCRTFCRNHRETIYQTLTKNYSHFVRADEMPWKAAELWPGIVPSKQEIAQEAERMQQDKDGLETHQGIFFAQMLADAQSGIHLLQAMMRPKPLSLELLEKFQKEGVAQFEYATAEAKNGAGYVYTHNPRYLNAEDERVVHDQETAIDLVLLHPQIKMGVMRGTEMQHPRYKGRRIFDAGLNLTRVYHGKLPYLFYPLRDWGMINKMFYGLAGDGIWEEDNPENTLEKPWLAAVDGFAIGGGCQLLLVMDYVIAEAGSYFNLPARKEGIIPGAANLRLSRFLGERAARQAILFDKTFYVESPEASALVNEVVPRERMDQAVEQAIDNALGSGMVSAAGNRKVLRLQYETLDLYRRYMVNYAEIQAQCHLSAQLIANLEKHWNARQKKI